MVNVGTMPIRLQMVTTPGQFKDKILRTMHAELTRKLASGAFKNSIRRGVKPILERALVTQDEYQSMVAQDGKLRAELGVVDSESAMNSLVRDWVRSTHVTVSRPRIVGSRLIGTILTVRAIQADYQDVLGQAYASYTTEKGQRIPWLEWLLTKGMETFIRQYSVVEMPTARSRTGTNTIMLKTEGGGWGVPEEFAGTPANNYATRAVIDAMPEIERLYIQEVRSRL